MQVFWKYILWLLSFLTIVIFYLLNTSLGQYTMTQSLSYFLSNKTKNSLKVSSLNIDNYPKVSMNIEINRGAIASFHGEVHGRKIDMDYHLTGNSFKYNSIDLKEKIDIKGHISGLYPKFLVEGEGETFEGDVAFSFIKTPKEFKSLKIALRDVNSKNILIYLKKKPLVHGKADIDAHFRSFSKYKRDGEALIYMEKATIPSVSRDKIFSFKSKMKFKNKELIVTGESDTFEGLLKYKYSKNKLELNLYGTSLVKLLRFFSYPALLSAKVYGSIDYDIKNKIVILHSKLKQTKFRKTKITDMIFNRTGIDILKDTYDDSSFIAGYQNSILYSTLRIDNGRDKHLYLTDTKLYSKTNAIKSKFEMTIGGQELYGGIYGTLKNPKVSIDMQKILKYQLEKQIGSFLGIGKKELIKRKLNSVKEDLSKSLEEVDVERVKEKAKSFLNDFF